MDGQRAGETRAATRPPGDEAPLPRFPGCKAGRGASLGPSRLAASLVRSLETPCPVSPHFLGSSSSPLSSYPPASASGPSTSGPPARRPALVVARVLAPRLGRHVATLWLWTPRLWGQPPGGLVWGCSCPTLTFDLRVEGPAPPALLPGPQVPVSGGGGGGTGASGFR